MKLFSTDANRNHNSNVTPTENTPLLTKTHFSQNNAFDNTANSRSRDTKTHERDITVVTIDEKKGLNDDKKSFNEDYCESIIYNDQKYKIAIIKKNRGPLKLTNVSSNTKFTTTPNFQSKSTDDLPIKDEIVEQKINTTIEYFIEMNKKKEIFTQVKRQIVDEKKLVSDTLSTNISILDPGEKSATGDNKVSTAIEDENKLHHDFKIPLIMRSNEFVKRVAYISATGSLATEFLFTGFTIKYSVIGTRELLTAFFDINNSYNIEWPVCIALGLLDLLINIYMFDPEVEAEALSKELPDGFIKGIQNLLSRIFKDIIFTGIPVVAMCLHFPAAAWADNDAIFEPLKTWLSSYGAWAVGVPVLYFAISYYTFFSAVDVMNNVKFFLRKEGIKQDYLWDLVIKGEFSTPYQVFFEAFSQHFIRSFIFGELARKFSKAVGFNPGVQSVLYWLVTAASGVVSLLTRHRNVYEYYLGNKSDRLDLINDAERNIIWKQLSWKEYLVPNAKGAINTLFNGTFNGMVACVQSGTQYYFTKLGVGLLGVSPIVSTAIGAASGALAFCGRWRANTKHDLGSRFLEYSKSAYHYNVSPGCEIQDAKLIILRNKKDECEKNINEFRCKIKEPLINKIKSRIKHSKHQLVLVINDKSKNYIKNMSSAIIYLSKKLFVTQSTLQQTLDKFNNLNVENKDRKTLEKDKVIAIQKIMNLKEQLTILITLEHFLKYFSVEMSIKDYQPKVEDIFALNTVLTYLLNPSYRRTFMINNRDEEILPRLPQQFLADLNKLSKLEQKLISIDEIDLDGMIAFLEDNKNDNVLYTSMVATLRRLRIELVQHYMVCERSGLVPKATNQRSQSTTFQNMANGSSQLARAITGAKFFPDLRGGFGAGLVTGVSSFRYFAPKAAETMPTAWETAKKLPHKVAVKIGLSSPTLEEDLEKQKVVKNALC